MPASLRVFVTLGKTEIDHVQDVLVLSATDKKVVWLDVSMQEAVLMDELDTL